MSELEGMREQNLHWHILSLLGNEGANYYLYLKLLHWEMQLQISKSHH